MTNQTEIDQSFTEFQGKVAAAEKAENPETSPYHQLLHTASVHQKFRGYNDLNVVYRLGFDELSRFLDVVESDFSAHPPLQKLVCLADRVHGNYRAAIICYLNGLDQTAFDIMRDVMEITYLVRDFVLQPDHIEEWADGSEDDRRDKFTSGKLRRRFADHLGVRPRDLLDTHEYNSHSGMLHINPSPHLLLQRGICKNRQPEMSARFALADIFHHAKDVSFIFSRLMVTLGVTPSSDPANMEYLPWAHCVSSAQFDTVMKFVDMAVEMANDKSDAEPANRNAT